METRKLNKITNNAPVEDASLMFWLPPEVIVNLFTLLDLEAKNLALTSKRMYSIFTLTKSYNQKLDANVGNILTAAKKNIIDFIITQNQLIKDRAKSSFITKVEIFLLHNASFMKEKNLDRLVTLSIILADDLSFKVDKKAKALALYTLLTKLKKSHLNISETVGYDVMQTLKIYLMKNYNVNAKQLNSLQKNVLKFIDKKNQALPQSLNSLSKGG